MDKFLQPSLPYRWRYLILVPSYIFLVVLSKALALVLFLSSIVVSVLSDATYEHD